MAEGSVVTTEPKSRRKEIEEFVRDLDPLQVAGKLAASVCTEYPALMMLKSVSCIFVCLFVCLFVCFCRMVRI